MLNKHLLLSAIAAVTALLLVSTYPSADASERTTTFDIGNVIVLGQSQNEARRNPTILDRWRQGWNRFLDDGSESSTNPRPAPVIQPVVPTTPPKPPTADEIRQSQNSSATNQGQRTNNAANTPQQRTDTASRNVTETRESDNRATENESVVEKMRRMREGVFPDQAALLQAAQTSRQMSDARAADTSIMFPFEIANNPRDFAGNIGSFTDLPDFTTQTPANPDPAQQHTFSQTNLAQTDTIAAVPNHAATSRAVPNQSVDPSAYSPISVQQPAQQPLQQPAQQETAALNVEPQPQNEGTRQLIVSTSPRLKLAIEKPESVVVGQEIVYQIRVANIGDAPAEGVVINAEIPSWLVIRHKDANDGGLVENRRGDGSGTTDLVWRINRITPDVTNILVLGLVPQQHREIAFPIRYDFERPAIVPIVAVREPRLEMELLGADEVGWNELVNYKLLVRNVGNGNADNIRLDLLQTSAGESFCEFPEPLRPGEQHELDIKVQAGREREHIDIAVVATGAHDVRAEVKRRLRVLRPRLEMTVQTLPLHFVENPAEFTIRVRNVGTADAENVTIRADLPLGVEYKSSSDNGMFAIQQQQNIVEWRGKTIPKGEIQTYTLVCEPRREGNNRISVEAHDSGGNVLVAGNGTFKAEAIVDLDLTVNAPKGPIELGQEVEYEIQVTNTGTKSAEDVEILIMFGHQFEPRATRGDSKAGVTEDGQVVFEKIPSVLPRQSVKVNVIVEATSIGTVPIRAEVIRFDSSGVPVSLQKGLSAHIFSRTASAVQTDEFFR